MAFQRNIKSEIQEALEIIKEQTKKIENLLKELPDSNIELPVSGFKTI